jgi:hypothetical protein
VQFWTTGIWVSLLHRCPNIFFLGATAPRLARASSLWRFRYYTQTHHTLNEWSARCRNLYLTTHNTHKTRTSVPPAVFEPAVPAVDRPQASHTLAAARPLGFLCRSYGFKFLSFVMNRNRDLEWYDNSGSCISALNDSTVCTAVFLPCGSQPGKWNAINETVQSYRTWRTRQLLWRCWCACYLNKCNKAVFFNTVERLYKRTYFSRKKGRKFKRCNSHTSFPNSK